MQVPQAGPTSLSKSDVEKLQNDGNQQVHFQRLQVTWVGQHPVLSVCLL